MDWLSEWEMCSQQVDAVLNGWEFIYNRNRMNLEKVEFIQIIAKYDLNEWISFVEEIWRMNDWRTVNFIIINHLRTTVAHGLRTNEWTNTEQLFGNNSKCKRYSIHEKKKNRSELMFAYDFPSSVPSLHSTISSSPPPTPIQLTVTKYFACSIFFSSANLHPIRRHLHSKSTIRINDPFYITFSSLHFFLLRFLFLLFEVEQGSGAYKSYWTVFFS